MIRAALKVWLPLRILLFSLVLSLIAVPQGATASISQAYSGFGNFCQNTTGIATFLGLCFLGYKAGKHLELLKNVEKRINALPLSDSQKVDLKRKVVTLTTQHLLKILKSTLGIVAIPIVIN